jgi:hypothetical protein
MTAAFKSTLLDWLTRAQQRHLQLHGRPLSEEECDLVILTLQAFAADITFAEAHAK